MTSPSEDVHLDRLQLPLIECTVGGHFHLARFTFALPGAIGVQDGFTSLQAWEGDGAEFSTWADVTIRQLQLPWHADVEAGAAMLGLLLEAPDGFPENVGAAEPPDAEDPDQPSLTTLLSVAQVVTPFHSPADHPTDWDQDARHLSPQSDAFMRALYATQTVVRAANLAQDGIPARLPSYEVLSQVFTQEAALTDPVFDVEDSNPDWSEPNFMILDKYYRPPPTPGHISVESVRAWEEQAGFGNSAIVVRENLQRTRRLMEVDGDYSQAVVAAAIGLESLCYNLLSATYWEDALRKGSDPDAILKEAARTLSSGSTPLKIASQKLPARLGGDWSSPSSAWNNYFKTTASLRNHVVHTGFLPTRAAAAAAVDAAFEAQKFLMDRLAEKRYRYPLCAYIFLGGIGLEKRGLLNRRITRRFDDIAAHPIPPSLAYADWSRALQHAVRTQQARTN